MSNSFHLLRKSISNHGSKIVFCIFLFASAFVIQVRMAWSDGMAVSGQISAAQSNAYSAPAGGGPGAGKSAPGQTSEASAWDKETKTSCSGPCCTEFTVYKHSFKSLPDHAEAGSMSCTREDPKTTKIEGPDATKAAQGGLNTTLGVGAVILGIGAAIAGGYG